MNVKNKSFNRYYLLSCVGILIASYYPMSMGIRVIADMIADGAVQKENYPKYIIPYTPMCIALIIGVLLMPLCIKLFKRFALACGAFISAGIFFALEFMFEQKVVVSSAETVIKLEDWQMFMCYVPTVTEYKTQTAVDILMGDYNPAFKLHFYIISVVLIISIMNCLYGFGQMIENGEKKRLKALILQSVCSFAFLALCILACFTAFWRDGNIQVSPLSAVLMAVFFILLGVTAGVFVGSFLLEKRKPASVCIPSITASAMTFLMYIGEMFLLNGHLYSHGSGILFDGLPVIVFAPIDLIIISASGIITALIFTLLNGSQMNGKKPIAAIFAVGAVVLLLISSIGSEDNPDGTYNAAELFEKKSGAAESSYQVGAALPQTDFSSVGAALADKIEQEWDMFDNMSMSAEQYFASSKIWGLVDIQADTWKECEEIVGFTVHNPLEAMDWLDKTGYFGMESAAPDAPVKHIEILADTASSGSRELSRLDITAGYSVEGIRITLKATLSADAGTETSESICDGYASYEEENVISGSGIPVLIITTHETNNTGFYSGDYFDPTAYWVGDNVFYTLRLIGDEADKAKIRAVLERILEDV